MALSSARRSLPGICEVTKAVELMAHSTHEERGAVYTRSEVVDFILDLAGYTTAAPLHQMRLLEPSAGDGEFVFRAIDRLLAVAERQGCAFDSLGPQIRVVELHHPTCLQTRDRVARVLRERGAPEKVASTLAQEWVRQGDFLLEEFSQSFTHVVGNPPYVRQEMIPAALLAEYRRRYDTLFDRADLYVPFIQRSLELLQEGGVLGFICADRWMKNKYGGPLRRLVSSSYHLRHFVDMVDTPAFHSDVIAYPAITILAREAPGVTRIVRRPAIDAGVLKGLSEAMTAQVVRHPQVLEVEGVAVGEQPWILENFERLGLVRRLEAELPSLEAAGCRVGIGVASGADEAFIGPLDGLAVEPERKLPLVMRSDLSGGVLQWRGRGIVNPFLPTGKLAAFSDYPKFADYILARRDQIDRRHVAQKNPKSWYRTIDRIYPDIAAKPKLLIPDIAGEANIVFEPGGLYPHHNLYFITSETWDLQALRAVLISGIAKLFIATYSTKMRGGYLRFQAQYLRRIRVPAWHDVSDDVRGMLVDASTRNDKEACNRAVALLYGLSEAEQDILAHTD